MSQVTRAGISGYVYYGCAASCTYGLTTYGGTSLNSTYMALCSSSSCNTITQAAYMTTCGVYSKASTFLTIFPKKPWFKYQFCAGFVFLFIIIKSQF